MADPKPAVLTLHNQSAQVITRIGDQLAYAIRWYFVNPGSTSSVNEGEMASFRKLNATLGNTPESLARATQGCLESIARRYYPGASVDVTVEKGMHRDEDGILQGTYGLVIKVMDQDGTPMIPSGHVKISGDENNKIDCVFGEQ